MFQKGSIKNEDDDIVILSNLDEKFVKFFMRHVNPFVSLNGKFPVIYNGRINWPIGVRFYIEEGIFIIRYGKSNYSIGCDFDAKNHFVNTNVSSLVKFYENN